jgi:hypothetical protein
MAEKAEEDNDRPTGSTPERPEPTVQPQTTIPLPPLATVTNPMRSKKERTR